MSDTPIVIESGAGAPDSCVIWLHGLGADGHDFEPIVPELKLNPELNIRFVFPHAPMMPVTINQGFMMRAWYDIKSDRIASEPDEAGIRRSAALVDKMIEEQIAAGIAADKIVLAGFSQGGAIVLQAGLRQAKPLAGIMALSTYLPLAEKLADEKTEANQNTPIFLVHGAIDQVIPIELAYTTRGQLEKAGYTPEWHEYEHMPHSVSLDEINHISAWLERVLRN
ncbi:MAG: alpha/beta hydrolase [Gammaproteobacteria bacterium]|nr:alpha/beta hydrolase [Gammaproteobacteria bacterium]